MMELVLYIADDIQKLESGKLILMGAYTDRVIVLNRTLAAPDGPTKDAPYALRKLGFVASVLDLKPGTYDFSFRISNPSGSEPDYSGFPSPTEKIAAGASAQFVFEFVPFLVAELGKYKFFVTVSGETLETTFEFRLAEKPITQLAAAPAE